MRGMPRSALPPQMSHAQLLQLPPNTALHSLADLQHAQDRPAAQQQHHALCAHSRAARGGSLVDLQHVQEHEVELGQEGVAQAGADGHVGLAQTEGAGGRVGGGRGAG